MELDVELPRWGEMSLEAVVRARDLQVRYEPSQTPDLPVPLLWALNRQKKGCDNEEVLPNMKGEARTLVTGRVASWMEVFGNGYRNGSAIYSEIRGLEENLGTENGDDKASGSRNGDQDSWGNRNRENARGYRENARIRKIRNMRLCKDMEKIW